MRCTVGSSLDLAAARLPTPAPTRRPAARCRACRTSRPRPRGYSDGSRNGCPVVVPVALPAEHAKAGNAEPRQRGAHEIGHGAEILGDDFGAGAAKDARARVSPSASCAGSSAGVKNAVAAVARPAVGAIEADEMIDAVAVEEIGAAPRALAQPAEILARDRRPTDRRGMPQSWPVALNASGGAPTDTSRRNCCCRAQTSALSPSTMNGRSPKSATPCVVARARCCHCVPASHCRYWWNSTSSRELAARAVDRRRIAPLQRRRATPSTAARPRARAARGTARSPRSTTPAR